MKLELRFFISTLYSFRTLRVFGPIFNQRDWEWDLSFQTGLLSLSWYCMGSRVGQWPLSSQVFSKCWQGQSIKGLPKPLCLLHLILTFLTFFYMKLLAKFAPLDINFLLAVDLIPIHSPVRLLTTMRLFLILYHKWKTNQFHLVQLKSNTSRNKFTSIYQVLLNQVLEGPELH